MRPQSCHGREEIHRRGRGGRGGGRKGAHSCPPSRSREGAGGGRTGKCSPSEDPPLTPPASGRGTGVRHTSFFLPAPYSLFPAPFPLVPLASSLVPSDSYPSSMKARCVSRGDRVAGAHSSIRASGVSPCPWWRFRAACAAALSPDERLAQRALELAAHSAGPACDVRCRSGRCVAGSSWGVRSWWAPASGGGASARSGWPRRRRSRRGACPPDADARPGIPSVGRSGRADGPAR